MKRVKLMLTAIGVLAVVGGAVAFKAAKFGTSTYCIENGGTACPVKVTGKSFLAGTTKYRQIPSSGVCTANTVCTATGAIQD